MPPTTNPPTRLCSFPGCGREHFARGNCNAHYWQNRNGYPLRPVGTLRISTEDRFWLNVNKAGPTMPGMDSPCWVWTGVTRDGYGAFSLKHRLYKAHRVAYSYAIRQPMDNELLLHRCDNRACVRPDHLWIGDNAANSADMVAKGRSLTGERHPMAKLTATAVYEIRDSDASLSLTAAKYGVSSETISRIRRRLLWHHLPEARYIREWEA